MIYLRILGIIGFFALSLGFAQAQNFLAALGDVPLMEGMQVEAGSVVQFETVSGRVVELTATVPGWVEFRRFYRDTLHNLGWQEVSEMRFVRAGESLQLVPLAMQKNTVRLHLAPNS